MTDQEFEQLTIDVENAMNEVDRLQALYRKETGKDFVRPIRLYGKAETESEFFRKL